MNLKAIYDRWLEGELNTIAENMRDGSWDDNEVKLRLAQLFPGQTELQEMFWSRLYDARKHGLWDN